MIRYDLKKREGGWYVMQPQPAGRYVTYLAVADLQRQLAEVTRERDTLKAMVDLHDAVNDRRRAQANETTFKRRTYENR